MMKAFRSIPVWAYAMAIGLVALTAVAYVAISRVTRDLIPVVTAVREEYGISPSVTVQNGRTLIITINAADLDAEPTEDEAKRIARTALAHYPRAAEMYTVGVNVIHSVRRGAVTVTTTRANHAWNTGLLSP